MWNIAGDDRVDISDGSAPTLGNMRPCAGGADTRHHAAVVDFDEPLHSVAVSPSWFLSAARAEPSTSMCGSC
jgi:hypothetical protein